MQILFQAMNLHEGSMISCYLSTWSISVWGIKEQKWLAELYIFCRQVFWAERLNSSVLGSNATNMAKASWMQERPALYHQAYSGQQPLLRFTLGFRVKSHPSRCLSQLKITPRVFDLVPELNFQSQQRWGNRADILSVLLFNTQGSAQIILTCDLKCAHLYQLSTRINHFLYHHSPKKSNPQMNRRTKTTLWLQNRP